MAQVNNVVKRSGVPFRLISFGILGLFLLFTLLSSFIRVSQNEVTVVDAWGKYAYTAGPGLHLLVPFMNGTTDYKTDIQTITTEDGKPVNTYTNDNQEVDVTFKVLVQLQDIPYIYQNNRNWRANILTTAIDRLKVGFGQVNVQFVSEKRGELRDKIAATLRHDLEPYGIKLVDFQLVDLQYTKSFRDAVNNAAVTKANVEAREYERQQAKIQADKDQIEALGKANAAREAAKGAADAVRYAADAKAHQIEVEGQATAASIKAQAEALKANPDLVKLKIAESWHGVLPQNVYGSAPIPFLNIDPSK